MNKNSLQGTNNWAEVWKSWASQKVYDYSTKKYEPEALNKILEQFYATVREKDGDDYEPDSLRVMVTAIDRFQTEKEYNLTPPFATDSLKARSKFLRAKPGYRDKKAKASGRTKQEV